MFFMKSKYILLLAALFLITVASKCKKTPPPTPPTPPTPEPALVITINPNPNPNTAQALAATYDFKINVSSTMPTGGVKYDILCTRDSDNSTVSSATVTSSLTEVNTGVSNLVSGVVCTVKVTATSQQTLTNIATLSFKVSRK
jgi:hypothetical protein